MIKNYVERDISFPPAADLRVSNVTEFEVLNEDTLRTIQNFYKVNIAIVCLADDVPRQAKNPGKNHKIRCGISVKIDFVILKVMKSSTYNPAFTDIILVVKGKPNFRKIEQFSFVPGIDELNQIRIGRNILTMFEAVALSRINFYNRS